MPNETPVFSIIVCSIDPWKFAQTQAMWEGLLAGVPHELIGIHNASSLAEGYNRALARARGSIVVFAHDDLLVLDPGFAEKIAARLQDFDLLGFAGTTKFIAPTWFSCPAENLVGMVAMPDEAKRAKRSLCLNIYRVPAWPVAPGVQALDGLCLIARRECAWSIGFDEETFDGFHLYDLDFSYRCHLAGKKLGICLDIPIIHASRGNYGDGKWHGYAMRFMEKFPETMPPEGAGMPKRAAGICLVLSSASALQKIWRKEVFAAVRNKGIADFAS
jgi:hypothetical protein